MFNWHTKHGIEVIGYEKTSFTEGILAYWDREMLQSLPSARAALPQAERTSRPASSSYWNRYNRGGIYHLTIGGEHQCKDLEEELLSFPVL